MTLSSSESRGSELEVAWLRGQIRPETAPQVPGLAMTLLELDPLDSDLATLAGMGRETATEVIMDAFEKLGEARGLPFLRDPFSRDDFLRRVIGHISNGDLLPREGAEMIAHVVSLMHLSDGDRDARLFELVGYARAWDEFPSQQSEFEQRIRTLAFELTGFA